MNIQELIESIIGGPMWQISDATVLLIDPPFSNVMSSIRIAAGLLAFGVLCLQAFKLWLEGFQGQETMRRGVTALLMAVIIMIFIQTGPYSLLMSRVIAGPPEAIAQIIFGYSKDAFMETMKESWGAVGSSKSEGLGMFTLNMGMQLLSTLIGGLVYLISTVLMVIMPILQKMLFKLMLMIGPLCMVFAISDYTKSIAKQWLNLTLAIAWLGVFASAAQMLGLTVQQGVINNAADPFKVLIYGTVSIIIQVSAFGLSAFLFSAVGSGLDRMANPVAAGAAVAGAAASTAGTVGMSGLATGAMARGTGAVMNTVGAFAQNVAPQGGGIGNTMRSAGGGMQSAGNWMKNAGNFVGGKSENIVGLSRGRFPGGGSKSTATNIQGKSASGVGGGTMKADARTPKGGDTASAGGSSDAGASNVKGKDQSDTGGKNQDGSESK